MATLNKRFRQKMIVESNNIFDKLSTIDVFNLIESYEGAYNILDFSQEYKDWYYYDTDDEDIYYWQEYPINKSLEEYINSEI